MSTDERLLTIDEYCRYPDPDHRFELVRGRLAKLEFPGCQHGWICAKVGCALGNFVERHDLGYVISNNSGVITERDPDSVRGPDIAYYSYERIPKGQLPVGYAAAPPELVFEVRSPDDRWKNILTKVAEYLQAGVLAVCVVDPDDEIVILYYPDRPGERLAIEKTLTLPDILPGFSVLVRDLF